jgi:hypothetical protein
MDIRYILVGILLILNIYPLFGFFGFRRFFIVLLILNAILMFVFLNSLVIILVSGPWYVKVSPCLAELLALITLRETSLGFVLLYPGCNMSKACHFEYLMGLDMLGKVIRKRGIFYCGCSFCT